jgi:hypothetical protein
MALLTMVVLALSASVSAWLPGRATHSSSPVTAARPCVRPTMLADWKAALAKQVQAECEEERATDKKAKEMARRGPSIDEKMATVKKQKKAAKALFA